MSAAILRKRFSALKKFKVFDNPKKVEKRETAYHHINLILEAKMEVLNKLSDKKEVYGRLSCHRRKHSQP